MLWILGVGGKEHIVLNFKDIVKVIHKTRRENKRNQLL